MKNLFNAYIRNSRFRRFWRRVVSVLACVVVFVTTYALIMPAITIGKNAQCGTQEHQHTDSCYEERLVCGQEESEGHTHTEDCYSVSYEPECGLEEHSHSADCYDEEGNLEFEVVAEEFDPTFDEIGSQLKIKQIQRDPEKQELLNQLELYYKVFFLGEDLENE